jgi:hypothetical protein
VNPVRPSAVRRKVEAWLDKADASPAIALAGAAQWSGDPVLTVRQQRIRVVPCPTPLAARAALYDRADGERIVLLTELAPDDLGDGLLAHLSGHTVHSVRPWDMVSGLFPGADLDPTLTAKHRWAADALVDYAPAGGWPAPPGRTLTRDHALRCLTGALLGIGDPDQIDSAGLLQWSLDAPAVLRYTDLPRPIVDGIAEYLADVAGPAAVPIMAAVRAGHGVDAIPLGLLVGVLWSGRSVPTEVAVARARLEPRFGGVRLTDGQALAFRDAAEAWVDRTMDSDSRLDARRMLGRAEAIAADIDAAGLLGASSVLPTGFVQRLRALAAAIVAALPNAEPTPVVAAQAALVSVEEHRAADAGRVATAQMAVRLLRWLSTPDGTAPVTLHAALHRQVRDDAWVDRARLDIFAGDVDPEVADAYRLLHRAVQQRRTRHDEQFAHLLAAATSAEAEPGAMLLIEQVLDRVVRPILDHGGRVLLLVLDGMSTAAATELAESITESSNWLELTPGGSARTGVLAALPTITEVSRASLFCGRIARGQQAEEQKAFAERFTGGRLLHKAALRAGAGAALDPDIRASLDDRDCALVAAVINTIDDALDRSEPGTVVWSQENIRAARDLLAVAEDRVVVILSDHGHVIDRGPDAVTRASSSSENRWRPADVPPGDGEVLVSGSRVAAADRRAVLPWREELRYGPRKSGYHGGASPAEAVIPLLVFSAVDESAVPGWAGAPVASPEWWREQLAAPAAEDAAAPAAVPPAKRTARAPRQDTALFDLDPVPPAPVAETPPPPAHDRLIAALLASPIYAERKGTRAPLPDERVAALLGVLLQRGGRATLDTLAANAGIPAHRISGVVTALRKLLQVEGYPVIEIDPDGRTVHLSVPLLTDQFHLDVA